MKQRDLNRAVAEVTGEAVDTIARRGFSLLDPEVHERDDPAPLDWDELQQQRVALFPDRQCAPAHP